MPFQRVAIALVAAVGLTSPVAFARNEPTTAAPTPAASTSADGPAAPPDASSAPPAPPAKPAPGAKATGPNPHLFPQDQTWPKTGAPFMLAGAKIEGSLPASSPNKYNFGTTRHFGLAIDTMDRTSPGPKFRVTIEPTYVSLDAAILTGLGVPNQCRNYVLRCPPVRANRRARLPQIETEI